jgi:hypothetical protein
MTEAITTTGSTVPRRQLGRYLRDLRNKSRLTVRAAGAQLEWSEAKIWRIETGQTSLRSLDAEAMCKVYGAPLDITEALMGLAKETKARGWWHSYGDAIPEYFDVYIGLEEAASQFSWYESELVPGLFQTEDYARVVIRADNPGVDDAEIERRVHVRLARQALLTRVTHPPVFDVVLNEAILHRPVGGQEAAQPAHTASRSQRAAHRVAPGDALQRRAAPRHHVRAIRDSAVPAQRQRPGHRATHGLRRQFHRSAVPGQTSRDRPIHHRIHQHLGVRSG